MLLATEDDFAAFCRRCQYLEADGDGRDLARGAHSSDSRCEVRSAVKRVYKFLERRYQLPPPFEIIEVGHWSSGWTHDDRHLEPDKLRRTVS